MIIGWWWYVGTCDHGYDETIPSQHPAYWYQHSPRWWWSTLTFVRAGGRLGELDDRGAEHRGRGYLSHHREWWGYARGIVDLYAEWSIFLFDPTIASTLSWSRIESAFSISRCHITDLTFPHHPCRYHILRSIYQEVMYFDRCYEG